MPCNKADAVKVVIPTCWGVAESDLSGRSRRRSLKPKGSIVIEKYDRIPYIICPRIGEPVFIEKKFQLYAIIKYIAISIAIDAGFRLNFIPPSVDIENTPYILNEPNDNCFMQGVYKKTNGCLLL